MADVYVAFVRDDQSFAEAMASALQGSGFTVSRSGSVQEAIETCPAVIFLWSPAAARSQRFIEYADLALRMGKMIIARLGQDPLPPDFMRAETHNLVRWRGAPQDPDLDPVMMSVDRLVARTRRGSHEERRYAAPPEQHVAPPPPAYAPQPQPPPPVYAPPPFTTQASGLRPGSPPYAPPPNEPPPPPRAFTPEPTPPPAPYAHGQGDDLTHEAAFWRSIQHSANPEDFEAYLARYQHNGVFSELAVQRIQRLRAQAKAAPEAPPLPRTRTASSSTQRGMDFNAAARAPAQTAPHPARMSRPADIDYAPAEPKRGGGRGLVFLLIAAALGGAGYWAYTQQSSGVATSAQEQEWTPPPPPEAILQPQESPPEEVLPGAEEAPRRVNTERASAQQEREIVPSPVFTTLPTPREDEGVARTRSEPASAPTPDDPPR
jgi:hypothetical protein